MFILKKTLLSLVFFNDYTTQTDKIKGLLEHKVIFVYV